MWSLNHKNKFEVEEVREFLKKFDLEFDVGVDYTVVIRENDDIIATASKEKNIIKCFAVDSNYQGLGLTNKLLTAIKNKLIEEGYFNSTIFTKLKNGKIFKDIGYSEVANTENVILLEEGNENIEKKIFEIISENNIDITKKRSMIVMNCNPFTLGHKYLIEQASKNSEEVLIFVLEEDKSVFPFEKRIELVKKGTMEFENVKVIPSTKYIISSATFPTYFLKEKNSMIEEYAKLDSKIVGEIFCKKLNIDTRFMGEEPHCAVTSIYNNIVKEILPKFGVDVVIIPRKEINNTVISASIVRKYLKEDNFEEIKKLVPKTTFDYLISDDFKKIKEKLW